MSDDDAKPSGRPFKPGQSGNPGGRPKEAAHVRELAREHTEMAIEKLADIVRTGKDRDAKDAAIALLDRGWGKPVTPLEVGKPATPPGASLLEQRREMLRDPVLAAHMLALAEATAEFDEDPAA